VLTQRRFQAASISEIDSSYPAALGRHGIPAVWRAARLRGDLGTVVEQYGPEAIGVEFVAASGRTQALVTLRLEDLRPVADDDRVAVRPAHSADRREG